MIQGVTGSQKIVSLIQSKGVLRPRDLAQYGIPRAELSRLCHNGTVQRVGRGLYRLADVDLSEHATIAEVCTVVPNDVICLLSALRFHDLTTQAPFEVWMAIDVKAHLPKTNLPVKFVRFSGPALSEGLEHHLVDGVPAKIYNLAKTVADCFKYRHKIGLDVALEALRECRKNDRCSMNDLWQYAKICRVSNVIRPYLEAMVI
jgi:predicted transcriptional regulator of viral defense system